MRPVPHVAVLPGDGIGPEVTAVAVRVLQAAGFSGTFSTHPVGWSEWCRNGEPLPAATLEACRAADAVLFGAITSKPEDQAQAELARHLRGRFTYRSPIVRLRRELDLFANVRPVQGPGIDLVMFRENTEDLYAGYEARPIPPSLREAFPGLPAGDAAVTLRLVTRQAADRICEAAFAYAQANGRRKVTLVEKANVLRATGAVMREAFAAAASRHPAIAADEAHIDAACARLVRDPDSFDVIVAANLFGDILSDIAAEVAGGLPLAASASLGPRHALFEPVHGSAPDIQGRGVANPLGAVGSAALLARHLGQESVAQRIEGCIRATSTGARTPDLGGDDSTVDVEALLLQNLGRAPITA